MCNQYHSFAIHSPYSSARLLTQYQKRGSIRDQANILFIKGEENANYPELDSGLFNQLGPPSHNSHIYPTPPKATRIEIIEERLEPPSPPFAQGRISNRIRAMFSGDHAIPRAPAARLVPHRGPIAATSDGVVPYLEPHEPTKKEYSNEKRLPPITPPTSPNRGRRYPWEPKRRPPPSPLAKTQHLVQAPPIKFPQFKLSFGELEDHVRNGLDLYQPVSSSFDDFDGSYFHLEDSDGTRDSQGGSSPNLSHKRSGLVRTIAARKQYPQVVKVSHLPPGVGQIVKQGVLSRHMPSPKINPPVFPVGPPVDKATDSWLSDGEESETDDSRGTPSPRMSQEEVDSSLPHKFRPEVLTQPHPHKGREIDLDTRRERGSNLLPPAIHLPAHQRSASNVKVVSPLFGPEAATTAALLLGTGKSVDPGDSMKVLLSRPVVHYRDLTSAGDRSFTWQEGSRPRASPPRNDGENTKGKSTNYPGELGGRVEESGSYNTPPRYPSNNDKPSAICSQTQLTSQSASMETVEDPHIDSPVATSPQPRRQIALISEHWVPRNRSPIVTTPASPSSHGRIFKSLATLTTSKSAPESSLASQKGGASIHTSGLESPEIPKAAETRPSRIKGAGPWLAKHLPQKKPANPLSWEASVLEPKKPQVPDPDENFEKFLQARAKEEEASHRPGRRRKHLGGVWEKQGD